MDGVEQAPEASAEDSELVLPDFGTYHGKGPNELKHGEEKDILFQIQIARQTAMTGEQLNIQIPVYKTDSKQEMYDRFHIAAELINSRLKEENDVLIALKKKQDAAKFAERDRQIAAQQAAKMKKLEGKGKLKVQR